MAIMPGAKFELVTGHPGAVLMRSHTGVVLHCNAAESYDLRSFFQGSSGDNAVSSHFQVTKDGTIFQYIDTAYQSWCQGTGNKDYISVESQGLASELATPAQSAAIARILIFLHDTHGIPLQLAERPGDAGFGWHGMGAAAGITSWGHALCPGDRRDQRAEMLALARATQPVAPVPPPEEDEDMPNMIHLTVDQASVPVGTDWPGEYVLFPNSGKYVHVAPGNATAFALGGALDCGKITFAQHVLLQQAGA